MNKNAGFTLIELLVVILIIGILSAVALPEYQKAVFKSRMAAGIPLARALKDAQDRYYFANGRWATDPEDLDINLPADCKVAFHSAWAKYTEMKCSQITYWFRFDGNNLGQIIVELPKKPSGITRLELYFPMSTSSTHSCYIPFKEPYCSAVGDKAQVYCKMFSSRPGEAKKSSCGEDYNYPL